MAIVPSSNKKKRRWPSPWSLPEDSKDGCGHHPDPFRKNSKKGCGHYYIFLFRLKLVSFSLKLQFLHSLIKIKNGGDHLPIPLRKNNKNGSGHPSLFLSLLNTTPLLLYPPAMRGSDHLPTPWEKNSKNGSGHPSLFLSPSPQSPSGIIVKIEVASTLSFFLLILM